ncbi:MAG: phosphotransferase [Chloroflexi bacterium]|nr:phosphotransferase [Chloroflexota bacterium]
MDRDAIIAFLQPRVGRVIDASLARVGHGEWSQAYFVTTTDGRDLVVRFSATDEDFRKDQRAYQFASAELPMPRLLELGSLDEGQFYAISERAHGDFFEERDDEAMQRLLPSLFATLDAARDVDISHTTGFGLWHADGNATHAAWRDVLLGIAEDPPSARTHGWRERLPETPVAHRAFDAAYARLQTLVDACPNARHLVHSDLLNFNVLVQGDRISAVFDWGSSMYADFLWDLAWLTFWQPWYTAWASVDVVEVARSHYREIGLDVANFPERLRCYELAIGLDGLAYEAWTGKSPENLAWTARRLNGLVDQSV